MKPPPKPTKSIRLSVETWTQLAALADKHHRTQPVVIEIAVDRMYREEFPKEEPKK